MVATVSNDIVSAKGGNQKSRHIRVLLVTVPGIAEISREDMDQYGDHWRFTTISLFTLLSNCFGNHVQVQSVGNVYSAIALLQGIALEELDRKALDYDDDQYQLLLTGRAVKRNP